MLANDTDIDGDALTATLVSNPTYGPVTLNSDGSFTYTPNGTFVGNDSFSYMANDGIQNSYVATATINVTNTAPGGERRFVHDVAWYTAHNNDRKFAE